MRKLKKLANFQNQNYLVALLCIFWANFVLFCFFTFETLQSLLSLQVSKESKKVLSFAFFQLKSRLFCLISFFQVKKWVIFGAKENIFKPLVWRKLQIVACQIHFSFFSVLFSNFALSVVQLNWRKVSENLKGDFEPTACEFITWILLAKKKENQNQNNTKTKRFWQAKREKKTQKKGEKRRANFVLKKRGKKPCGTIFWREI